MMSRTRTARRSRETALSRRFCAALLSLFILLPFPASAAGIAEDVFPTYCEGIDVETADATGTRYSAADCVAGTAVIGKYYCYFGAESNIRVRFAATSGRTMLYSGDGVGSGDTYTIAEGTVGTLYGLTRISNRHWALARVSATKSGTSVPVTVCLWVSCTNSKTVIMRPAQTAYHIFEQGEIAAFDTGIPEAEVALVDENGECVTTAVSDENGRVIFDAAHSADGQDHRLSVTWSFGAYDYHTATAYAASHLLGMKTDGYTEVEWVSGNNCATYQSRVMCKGGFPIYGPYTVGDNYPGQGIFRIMSGLIGSDSCIMCPYDSKTKTYGTFTADDIGLFHEGDLVYGHNMGHVMYCSAVDEEAGTVHVYGHSGSTLPNDGWVSVTDLNGVIRLVQEETFTFSFTVNGIADPRMAAFDANGGAEVERLIVAPGTEVTLPDCAWTGSPAMVLTGWTCGEETYEAGSVVTVTDHMTFTACWTEAIRVGIADLVLPTELAEIGPWAFANVPAATVYISDGCASIGPYAFAGCANLRQVRIPAGCTVDRDAFAGCTDLTVFAPAGSAAEDFCGASGFAFRAE